jgi:hypothetical protein
MGNRAEILDVDFDEYSAGGKNQKQSLKIFSLLSTITVYCMPVKKKQPHNVH